MALQERERRLVERWIAQDPCRWLHECPLVMNFWKRWRSGSPRLMESQDLLISKAQYVEQRLWAQLIGIFDGILFNRKNYCFFSSLRAFNPLVKLWGLRRNPKPLEFLKFNWSNFLLCLRINLFCFLIGFLKTNQAPYNAVAPSNSIVDIFKGTKKRSVIFLQFAGYGILKLSICDVYVTFYEISDKSSPSLSRQKRVGDLKSVFRLLLLGSLFLKNEFESPG